MCRKLGGEKCYNCATCEHSPAFPRCHVLHRMSSDMRRRWRSCPSWQAVGRHGRPLVDETGNRSTFRQPVSDSSLLRLVCADDAGGSNIRHLMPCEQHPLHVTPCDCCWYQPPLVMSSNTRQHGRLHLYTGHSKAAFFVDIVSL